MWSLRQRLILVSFGAGLAGLLAGLSSLAGGSFFEVVSVVAFWGAAALLAIALIDAAGFLIGGDFIRELTRAFWPKLGTASDRRPPGQ